MTALVARTAFRVSSTQQKSMGMCEVVPLLYLNIQSKATHQ